MAADNLTLEQLSPASASTRSDATLEQILEVICAEARGRAAATWLRSSSTSRRNW